MCPCEGTETVSLGRSKSRDYKIDCDLVDDMIIERLYYNDAVALINFQKISYCPLCGRRLKPINTDDLIEELIK